VLDSGEPVAALAVSPATAQLASDPLAAIAMHKKDNVLIIIGSPLGAQGSTIVQLNGVFTALCSLRKMSAWQLTVFYVIDGNCH
jgi:hypothetical protein